MPVKKYNPTSPARRFMTVSTFEEITKKKPEKSLLAPIKKLWKKFILELLSEIMVAVISKN